jgi:hypothetical protein
VTHSCTPSTFLSWRGPGAVVDGATLFQHACAIGLEDIVAKQRDRPYRSGRCQDWVKSRPERARSGEAPGIGRLFRRRMLGAGGFLGSNVVLVCGSRLGAGMVLLVRIRNNSQAYSIYRRSAWPNHRAASPQKQTDPAGSEAGSILGIYVKGRWIVLFPPFPRISPKSVLAGSASRPIRLGIGAIVMHGGNTLRKSVTQKANRICGTKCAILSVLVNLELLQREPWRSAPSPSRRDQTLAWLHLAIGLQLLSRPQ